MAVFIEREDYEFLVRAEKFCEKIDNFIGLLELDPIEVHNFKVDNELFNYVFAHQENYGTLAESFTKYKITNLQWKFSELMSCCKCSKNYTARIGEELGITSLAGSVDPGMYLPQIRVDYTNEGSPVLKWEKGMFEGVEIWKNYGGRLGYQKLIRCNGQEYVDKTPLPESCVVWKYSMIYLFKDEMVGNWSEEVGVVVTKAR